MVISKTPYEQGAEATRIDMRAYATRLDRSNPIRLAVVGAGRMGRRHIAAAAHAAGVELGGGLRSRARRR